VKREHPLMGQEQNWDDVGAAWDDIAESDGEGDGDGIRWADDAEGPAYIVRHHGYRGMQGPMDEMREEHAEEDSETVMGHDSPASLTVTAVGDPEPIDVPDLPVETGSPTSSSDGSPVEKLGAALEAMRMDRGRARAQTPIQGNVDW
jgi:3-phosphoinositide dependent protein kinase-1